MGKYTDKKRNILEYDKNLDNENMMRYLEIFAGRYPHMNVENIGNSFMGRSIPLITLGRGEKAVIYVGGASGKESVTSIALLKFINEYCELCLAGGQIYGNTLASLYSERTIYIVPMLDPDGVDYNINGIKDKNSLYDKLCNGEEEYSFEAGALINFIRFNNSIKAIFTIRNLREGIAFSGVGKNSTRAMSIARCFSKFTGYGLESFGDGEHDIEFALRELEGAHISVRCGEISASFSKDAVFSVYSDIRKILFSAPFMI